MKPSAEQIQKVAKFQTDPKYGPRAGITPEQRWNRAEMYGLKPDPKVLEILRLFQQLNKKPFL